jgi:hypothetical protein
MDTRQCARCKKVKPLEDFALARKRTKGRDYNCKPCKAEITRERRAAMDPDQLAEQRRESSKAYRAGMRENSCAICRTTIKARQGICEGCAEHVEALGGLEGLKQAVRAVRYLSGKE